MDIVSRKENKLLNRIEIKFSWLHAKQATPSRQAVMNLVKTLEPGSKVEPEFIHKRHKQFHSSSEAPAKEEAPAEEAPAEEAPAEEEPAEEGGDE